MESGSLRVEDMAGTLTLSAAQRSAVELIDPVVIVTGPPRSGKTTALAARALAACRRGRMPLVVCSHDSGSQAFRRALASLDTAQDAELLDAVATLPQHAARWLRDGYALAACAPRTSVGGPGVARHIVAYAARGLLDMTWPLFARAELDLDLPHLSRPDAFLDEAAKLFGLLQRARITPDEFEKGCAGGLGAFYGQGVERAQVLIADPLVHKRASARGRAALRVSETTLAAQKNAELGLSAMLVQLYRDYCAAAARAELRAPEDLTGALVAWLCADAQAVALLQASIGEILVDDADDAEPGLNAVLDALRQDAQIPLVMAGHAASAVDGFQGRRSCLDGHDGAARVQLPPLRAPAQLRVERFADEQTEVGWIAERIEMLLQGGAAAETIAVLTRSEDAACAYAAALRERGLPVAKPSTQLERPDEMADLLALCAVVDDPTDQGQLLRVLASPVVGLCDAHLWALCKDPAQAMQLSLDVGAQSAGQTRPDALVLARNVMTGAADAILSETARVRVAAFRERMAAWQAACRCLPLTARFIYIAEVAGFRRHWDEAQPYLRRRLHEDCERMARAIELGLRGGATGFPELGRWFEDEVVPLGPLARWPGAIVADTIVSAKGEHFDHVFAAGVAHERFPRIYASHAMAFSRTYGLIVRENVAPGASQTAKFAWYYARFGAKRMYLDEERRALDYALSRATVSADATGYGTPPHWARDHDLLATLAQLPAS